MEASYDPEADAAYVRVQERRGAGRTEVARDGTILDIEDESGDVIGYELLEVRSRGLDAFQTVPEAGRRLVAFAVEEARVQRRFIRVSSDD